MPEPAARKANPASWPPGAPPAPRAPPRGRRPDGEPAPPGRYPWIDLASCMLLAVAAAVAAAKLPLGPARYALVAPMLLVVPGYALLQVFAVPAPAPARRALHALAALGVSPAVVGLLALSTAVVQGGFRLPVIVGFVTVGTLGLATAALVRRRSVARTVPASDRHPGEDPLAAPAPPAATAKSGPTRP